MIGISVAESCGIGRGPGLTVTVCAALLCAPSAKAPAEAICSGDNARSDGHGTTNYESMLEKLHLVTAAKGLASQNNAGFHIYFLMDQICDASFRILTITISFSPFSPSSLLNSTL